MARSSWKSAAMDARTASKNLPVQLCNAGSVRGICHGRANEGRRIGFAERPTDAHALGHVDASPMPRAVPVAVRHLFPINATPHQSHHMFITLHITTCFLVVPPFGSCALVRVYGKRKRRGQRGIGGSISPAPTSSFSCLMRSWSANHSALSRSRSSCSKQHHTYPQRA